MAFCKSCLAAFRRCLSRQPERVPLVIALVVVDDALGFEREEFCARDLVATREGSASRVFERLPTNLGTFTHCGSEAASAPLGLEALSLNPLLWFSDKSS